MDVVENPLPAQGEEERAMADSMESSSSRGDTPVDPATPGRSELEAVLEGLMDSSLSKQQAAAEMERLIDGRVDRLRDELTTDFTGRELLGPLIQTIFAHMTEAPTNVRLSTHNLSQISKLRT